MVTRRLPTIEAVIKELGGNQAVADLTGRATDQAVSNWKGRNSLPLNTYTVLKSALRARGFSAPDALWGMPEVERAS